MVLERISLLRGDRYREYRYRGFLTAVSGYAERSPSAVSSFQFCGLVALFAFHLIHVLQLDLGSHFMDFVGISGVIWLVISAL